MRSESKIPDTITLLLTAQGEARALKLRQYEEDAQEEKNGEAHYRFATIHQYVHKDIRSACLWYEKAFHNGYQLALNALYSMGKELDTCPRNNHTEYRLRIEALDCYQRAAILGSPLAQEALAYYYRHHDFNHAAKVLWRHVRAKNEISLGGLYHVPEGLVCEILNKLILPFRSNTLAELLHQFVHFPIVRKSQLFDLHRFTKAELIRAVGTGAEATQFLSILQQEKFAEIERRLALRVEVSGFFSDFADPYVRIILGYLEEPFSLSDFDTKFLTNYFNGQTWLPPFRQGIDFHVDAEEKKQIDTQLRSKIREKQTIAIEHRERLTSYRNILKRQADITRQERKKQEIKEGKEELENTSFGVMAHIQQGNLPYLSSIKLEENTVYVYIYEKHYKRYTLTPKMNVLEKQIADAFCESVENLLMGSSDPNIMCDYFETVKQFSPLMIHLAKHNYVASVAALKKVNFFALQPLGVFLDIPDFDQRGHILREMWYLISQLKKPNPDFARIKQEIDTASADVFESLYVELKRDKSLRKYVSQHIKKGLFKQSQVDLTRCWQQDATDFHLKPPSEHTWRFFDLTALPNNKTVLGHHRGWRLFSLHTSTKNQGKKPTATCKSFFLCKRK